MEPEPLNAPPNEDEKLVALLRRNTPALPDDGFSARVLASLPKKTKTAKNSSLAALLGAAGGIVGLIVALACGATFDGFGESFAQTLAVNSTALASPETGIAVVVAALCLFFSYLLTKYSAEIF